MLDATGASLDDEFLLSRSPPSRQQIRLAMMVALGLLLALLVTVPFAAIPLPHSAPLFWAYAAAVMTNELITAALLLSLFSVERSVAVLILAGGYLFSALMAIPWALTFPDVLAPSGLLDASLQSAATVAALRRVGFPLFILAYTVLKAAKPILSTLHGSASVPILLCVSTIVALAAGLTWLILANEALLPGLMLDSMRTSSAWQYVPASASLLCAGTLLLLVFRRRSALDLWLMVVLVAVLIETLLLGYFSAGRFSVGWWAGRGYGLAAASIVLLVLLVEATTLRARLVRSISAERRAREARLTAMQALSASIAHEVNQPLASMITNADAGLRWLLKETPSLAETRAALQRIVNDGHRAGKVIEGIRTMFKQGARAHGPLDLNQLIGEVLKRGEAQAQSARVVVHMEFDAQLPPVVGNPVQLQEVVLNLVANAIDAMSSVPERERVLRITSGPQRHGDVLVSVEDRGSGLHPTYKERIFEPFFSTKPDGMGMGLMICRSVVEAHGGQLWATDNVPRGTIFCFTLPSGDDRALPEGRQTP